MFCSCLQGNRSPTRVFDFSDPFFQNARPWKIALSVILVAVVALSIVAVYLLKMKGTILGWGCGPYLTHCSGSGRGLGGRDPFGLIWTPLPCAGLELQM